MDRIEPRLWRGIQAFAGSPPDGFIAWTDIEHLLFLGIGHPKDFADMFRQLVKPLLTFLHRSLGLLAFGNVGGDAASRIRLAGMVAQREFDRDVGMGTIGMWRVLLIFHRSVPL